MARKTVITKVLDANAEDGIIEFPQNKTLYADQFTDEAPNTDEDREGFKPKNMNEVFEHYQPSKNGVALETEEGGAVYESEAKGKIDALNSVIRQLEKNKTLRNTLKDEAARGNLANALKALLAEIEDAE